MNTENSRANIGGLGATGSREHVVNANIFTNSTWPGFQNADLNVVSQNITGVDRAQDQVQQQMDSVGQISSR